VTKETNSACARIVQASDFDRYLSGLFCDASTRAQLYALYAFNVEIAKTANVVSEPMLGEIRLQWWKETIGEIYHGTVRPHEVVQPLCRVIADKPLALEDFHRLIEGRRHDLDPAALREASAFADYAANTRATLLTLASGVVAHDCQGPELARAIELGGLVTCAYELAQRAAPDAIPDREQLFGIVEDNLDPLQARIAALPDRLLPVFLPLSLARPGLKKARRRHCAGDPGPADLGPLDKRVRMLWSFITKRV